MPSFDIVSQLDLQEVDNAVNQSIKEVVGRYDFKGSRCQLKLEKEAIQLLASNEFKMKALIEVLQTKIVKRQLSLKSFDFAKAEPGPEGLTKCRIGLIQGIETDKAKELVKKIKEMGLKVQAAILDEQLRVTGKNRDDLQAVIQQLRGLDFSLPLQFINFRD